MFCSDTWNILPQTSEAVRFGDRSSRQIHDVPEAPVPENRTSICPEHPGQSQGSTTWPSTLSLLSQAVRLPCLVLTLLNRAFFCRSCQTLSEGLKEFCFETFGKDEKQFRAKNLLLSPSLLNSLTSHRSQVVRMPSSGPGAGQGTGEHGECSRRKEGTNTGQ